jgi:hypothetical protein
MNVKARPIINTGQISPRSLGYSYLPGSAQVATLPAPGSTFGTPSSPTTGSVSQPFYPGAGSIAGNSRLTTPRQSAAPILNQKPSGGILSGLFG